MDQQYRVRTPTDRLMNVVRGEVDGTGAWEDALFCYWCGCFLSDIKSGLAGESHNGEMCTNCGERWPRLYASVCVTNCTYGFNHFYSPIRVTIAEDRRRVMVAEGFTWCECGTGQIYRWSLDSLDSLDSQARLRLAGWGEDGVLRQHYYLAREAIMPDS